MKYFQLSNEATVPDLEEFKPFRCVLVIESDCSEEWQTKISTWLVKSGCVYMMDWGKECSSWDTSVDVANLEEFDYGDIPYESFVMTTLHDNEPISEVFWYSKNTAIHNSHEKLNSIVLHLSETCKNKEFTEQYKNA